jgi:hypothetical protein
MYRYGFISNKKKSPPVLMLLREAVVRANQLEADFSPWRLFVCGRKGGFLVPTTMTNISIAYAKYLSIPLKQTNFTGVIFF